MPIPFKDFPYETTFDLGEVVKTKSYIRPVYQRTFNVKEELELLERNIIYGSSPFLRIISNGLVRQGLPEYNPEIYCGMNVEVLLPRKSDWKKFILLESSGINVKPRIEPLAGIVLEEVVFAGKSCFEYNRIRKGDEIAIRPVPQENILHINMEDLFKDFTQL